MLLILERHLQDLHFRDKNHYSFGSQQTCQILTSIWFRVQACSKGGVWGRSTKSNVSWLKLGLFWAFLGLISRVIFCHDKSLVE